MGITLYRPGNTSKIHGIKCEAKTFDEYSYLHNLENGWFYSPEECYAEKETEEISTEEEAPEETETEETDGVLILDDMEDKEIRALARKKGIPNWYNKGIDKLKLEIDAWQPEI